MENRGTTRRAGFSRTLHSLLPELWIGGGGARRLKAARQESTGNYLAILLLVLIAYSIAGRIGQATTSVRSGNLGPVWPAYGIALTSILLYGYRVWPGVAVAAFLVASLSSVSPLAAFGQAVGATLAALTGGFLLRRADFNPTLSRLRDALGLIVFGAFGSAIVSASIGVLSLEATHAEAYSGSGAAWLIYWLGDSTGVLLVTPLILTLPSLLRVRSRTNVWELLCLLLCLIAACLVLFGDFAPIQIKFNVMAFAVLPFVLWAAIKFGTGGASLSVLVIGTIATVAVASGQKPFTGNSAFTNAVLLDVFFSVLALSGQLLAAVIAERDQAARNLSEEKLREYKNAVEGAEEMIAIVDREYRYVIANRKFLEYRNMTKEQVIGQLIPDVLNEGVFDEVVKDKLDRCFQGEVVRYEMKYKYPELGERNVFISYFPIEGSNGVDRAACIIQDVTERRQAQEAIYESEKRFRLVANTAPVMIWMCGADQRCNYFNQLWLDFTGLSETELQAGLAGVVHPDDYQRGLDIYFRAFDKRQSFKKECRLRRHDGQYRWVLDVGVPRFHEDGSFAGYIGSCIDVTDSKQAEEVLSSLNRRLIEAHEEERTWIARELHDDITQRLALVAIELDQLKQNQLRSAEVRERIDGLSGRINQLASDTQAIAHRFHSAKLEFFGIAKAGEALCKELAWKYSVEIDFRHRGVPSQLPQEVSLCLFRVLQEALANGVKHSGARHFDVVLTGSTREIELVVSDSGRGFDAEEVMKAPGLGLISMRERLNLVAGEISIQSRLNSGTTVHARVPLRPQASFATSAD
jgi:PAS domain S-box-containing protein